MRQHISGFVMAALFCTGLNLRAEDSTTHVPVGYRLVWADEFSKDPNGLPDPNKWSYEEGFIRNRESQYYTKERKENARVENGQLVIEARKEAFSPPDNAANSAARPISYTSASLETKGKASWQYGLVEIRAKLPAGDGVWPAIWMLGTGLPKLCGEIDLMELVGKNPDVIHGTIHYNTKDTKGHKSSGGLIGSYKSDYKYQVYAMELNYEHIDLFVDDRKYFDFDVDKATQDGQNPFQQPYYLKLNLALGGTWGGPIDDSIFPQRMVVDYIRVYQKTTSSP